MEVAWRHWKEHEVKFGTGKAKQRRLRFVGTAGGALCSHPRPAEADRRSQVAILIRKPIGAPAYMSREADEAANFERR
jgi:hypothetical protein